MNGKQTRTTYCDSFLSKILFKVDFHLNFSIISSALIKAVSVEEHREYWFSAMTLRRKNLFNFHAEQNRAKFE